MERKDKKKELDSLENSIENVLNEFSVPPSQSDNVDDELSDLENLVQGALTELTDLESNMLHMITPGAQNEANRESNYVMAVRRFQNAMKIALLDGVSKRDINIYEEAFNFYKNALELIQSTGNQNEIEQIRQEFAKLLIQITTNEQNYKDPGFEPFLFKACATLGEIYDHFGDYNTSSRFHNKAGDLTKDGSLHAEMKYFEAFIALILLGKNQKAQNYTSKLQLRHFQAMAKETLQAINEKNTKILNKIKTKIEVMGAQKTLKIDHLLFLLNTLEDVYTPKPKSSPVETINLPPEAKVLSQKRMKSIQQSLTKGIEKIQNAHPNLNAPIKAEIDTDSIISKIKQAISSEISREIKTLSNDIVSQILKKMPTVSPSPRPQPRSAGTLSDENAPDIDMVATAPGEKPKRPKLDDMLSSVIVMDDD